MNFPTDFTPPTTGDPFVPASASAEAPLTIPVLEERLQVGKELVETGRVRLEKKVHEREEMVEMPLTHDEVSVERVAVNRYVESPPPVRYEGDTTVIPVLKEVIEKRLVLVEELRVTRHQVQTHDSRQVTLRSETIEVQRLDANPFPEPTS